MFARGDFSLRELGNVSSGLESEILITRIGQRRYMNLIGSHGATDFTLEAGEKLLLHTHPGQGYWGLQRSAFGSDFSGLPVGVDRSAVLNESGWWRIYRRDGTLSDLYRAKSGGK